MVRVETELTRLITQPQPLYDSVLYDTGYDRTRLFCFLGTTHQQAARLSENLSRKNLQKRKPSGHIDFAYILK